VKYLRIILLRSVQVKIKISFISALDCLLDKHHFWETIAVLQTTIVPQKCCLLFNKILLGIFLSSNLLYLCMQPFKLLLLLGKFVFQQLPQAFLPHSNYQRLSRLQFEGHRPQQTMKHGTATCHLRIVAFGDQCEPNGNKSITSFRKIFDSLKNQLI